MTTLAEVKLWGRTIGAVSLEDANNVAAFQYAPDFSSSGIEVSPIVMPLSDRVYTFPGLSQNTFHGLPGLLADSLPDKFGNALIDAWLEENGRRHFMTKRFDRLEGGEKLHMQSLGAMAHFDFNNPGAHSYEQALLVMRQLNLSTQAIEEQFRRMAFNIIARNQDDHVKNIAFLMDKTGKWSLAPAFDTTYSFNPNGTWTASHQMTLNGKRDEFSIADFQQCAKNASMKRGRAVSIVDEVQTAVSNWPKYAKQAQVIPAWSKQVNDNLRVKIPRQ